MNTGMEYEDILMRNQELMAQTEQLHKKIAYLTEQAERWEDDALRLMKERNEALGEIELLRSTVTDCRIEIEKLRNERDEARREVCRDEAYRPSPSPPCTANQVANRRGWDCFKQEDGK
jgi:hypothetical protein